MAQDYSIRSVQRALMALSCFHDGQRSISLTELSRQLGLNKSTTYRLLVNLTEMDFLELDANGEYTVGSELARLGSLCNRTQLLKDSAHKAMLELSRLSGETVVLTQYQKCRLICIDKIESGQALRITSKIGANIPMLKGATGKAVTAYLPEEEAALCIENQRILGCPAPEHLDNFQRDMAGIRAQGFCVTHSELDQGVSAFAVPLFGSDNFPLGSLSICGPSSRFTSSQIEDITARALDLVAQVNLQRAPKHMR